MKTACFKLFVIFVAIIFSAVSFCLAQAQYVVTDLGTLGGYSSEATAINNNGQVVGWADSAASSGHAFIWQSGSGMQDLGRLGRVFNCAEAINNSGQVVGGVDAHWCYRAFLSNDNGPIQNLFGFPPDEPSPWKHDSWAYGINDSGQIVGWSDTADYYPHAFLRSSNGLMQDLGTLGGNVSSASSINNNGQVVGWSTNGNGYPDLRCAFIWQSGSGMQDIGSLGGNSYATAINNNGQVVGESISASGKSHAFIWQSGSGMQDLGTLGTLGGSTSSSEARSINNRGQIVGESSFKSGYPHAFIWQNDSGMQDLNNLVTSQLTLVSAGGINDFGQIAGRSIYHAVLLTPVGKTQAYQVQPPSPPIERLAKWDGTNWVSVNSGDLSSGNIHVLVHGWGAGLRTFANNGGKIWDEKDPETGTSTNDQYLAFTLAAQSVKSVAPGDTVVLFDWLDMSATDTMFTPWESLANADEAAGNLVSALKTACDFTSTFNGKLQFLGMSHGARVAALATESLYNGGKPGSVVVDQLTFGDSPEIGPEILGGANKIDKILPNINIGRSSGTTFVDNYYSYFGDSYTVDDDIVNVKLNPDTDLSPGNKHGYPLNWYSGASVFTDNLGLAWSPLEGDAYKMLGSSYEQDWKNPDGSLDWSREYTLKEIDTGPFATIEKQSKLNLKTLLTQGAITGIPNGMLLTENSPAYWHTGFTKNPDDTTIEFTYQFLNPGDGDQLGLWIDDELRFIITGQLVGTQTLMSDIDISDLSNGNHILSIALHNYGDANASVQVLDFTMLSVPEPSSLCLLCAAAIFVAIAMLFRRKSASV